ncbi:MAG: hypothetical protein KBH45_09230, partial [Verrucomicrobia bacterium]|nr:hypothetical protein [Verrucomicrobiota bacterium]
MNQTLTKSKAVLVYHLILAALLFARQPLATAAAETGSATTAAAPAPASTFTAKWIWRASAATNSYNQTIIAQKKFTLGEARQATLRITADSFYRLFINGHWVNDGPGRSWPEHFQYDVIDATPFLVVGANEIRVVARYFGVGDFHRVPKQAGLLAQLDVTLASGKTNTV